jgi:hypothetical protein
MGGMSVKMYGICMVFVVLQATVRLFVCVLMT